MAVVVSGALAALCPPGRVAAQAPDQAHITVAPTIVAKEASEAVLVIKLGRADLVPPGSFLSLGGVPQGVSLTDAHLVSPGLWAIRLSALPTVRAWIPAEVSGRAEIVITLIAMDGRQLAQTKTALVIEPASAPAAVPKARAGHLLARGLDYLAAGNILAARDFFERAAELGLAAAALRLGATYDPIELSRLKVQGVVADRALARKWYERARDLGAPDAAARLAGLGGDK